MNETPPATISDVAKLFARTPSILLVEDEPMVANLLRRILVSFDVHIDLAVDRASVEAALHDGQFDMVILDLVVPDISRMDLIRLMAEKTECPVMIMSGHIDPGIQQAAISILDRPIWFVEKPTMFTPESFSRVFRMFNLAVGQH